VIGSGEHGSHIQNLSAEMNEVNPSSNLDGLVVKAQSGFFTVETDRGIFVCQLRGKLKKDHRHQGDLASVGDRVRISILPDQRGMIEEVAERHGAITRLDPRPQGEYQQVLLANLDQAVFVFSCSYPTPKLRMLDRYLVIAEKQRIPPVIVANKIDLVDDPRKIFGLYEPVGYRVLYTSARNGYGLDEFESVLKGKISTLAGPSGVGKSSLLNAIQPGLDLEVDEVSAAVQKGKHATVVRQLLRLTNGGYISDTPGWRSLALWDTQPEEIDAYFPELAPLVSACQFSDCTHSHEPGCAVRAAVNAGTVHPQRYESYLRLRSGEK